jgi:glycosyltransferase involved in cell wall biosynthesis
MGFGGGGAERQLSYLAGGLEREGVDVHVAYRTAGPNIDLIREQRVALHELYGSSNYDPRLVWKLIRTIRRVRPHLIQTWLTQMDVLAGTAALMTRTPFIVTERSAAPAYAGNWKERVRERVGRRAAAVVANSHSGKDFWMSLRHPGPISVIPNGVPVADIERSRMLSSQMRGLGDSTEVILFAGRYSPEKNLFTLSDAIFRVLSVRTNAIAIFFGEGPLRNELVAKVESHQLTDRVWILDYTSELWSWMRRASLFVSVSTFEGSPNTVMEAAVQKCPLVLSDIRQHTELLGADAASFVPPTSSTAIAASILEALGDASSAKRKAQLAYERASRLTVEAMAGEYARLYRRVLDTRESVA